MNKETKMIIGYIAGGLLVIVLVPSVIYLLSSVADRAYRLEIIQKPVIQWSIIIMFFITGMVYGIWSIVIQNTIGKGGPLEFADVEISPKTEKLVVTGPYKHTRNPMLFGTFLMYLAFAVFINSVVALILVGIFFTFMLTVVVKMEEQRLLKDFGSPYEEYRKTVPKFIPWFQKK